MNERRNKPHELRITRLYDAPLKAVWDAWTDPKQVAQWWGPRGFSLTTHSKELRPGGIWHYTMHGPDGTDYPNKTLYLEVEPYAKLVYDHGGNDERAPLFRVTVQFSEVNQGTLMDMTMAFPSAEAAVESKKFIKQAGGNTTWDRLAEYVNKVKSGRETFSISRSFNAPLKLMFELWTNPKHFSRWLPPTGLEMEFIRSEITPGGSTFYFMTDREFIKMYGRAQYLEIEEPHRLRYTQQFCDENEHPSRHPFAPTWPETMLTSVRLEAEGELQTRVTVTWEPYGDVTTEELATFTNSRSGMTQGWSGSFEKLDALLSAHYGLAAHGW